MSYTKETIMEKLEVEAFMDDSAIMGDFMEEMQDEKTAGELIREVCKNKLVPIFNHPVDEKHYIGIARITDGPHNISDNVGWCKIRFYDNNEETGAWVNLKYTKEFQRENR